MPSAYLASITGVEAIGSGLWSVSVRLSDGSPHNIVVPERSLSLDQIHIAVAAAIAYYKLTEGPPTL